MITIFTIDNDKKDSVLFVLCPPEIMTKGLKIINFMGYKYRTSSVFCSKEKIRDSPYFNTHHYICLLGKKGKFPPPQPPKLRLPSVQYYSGNVTEKLYDCIQQMFPDKIVVPLDIFDIEKVIKNE